MFFRQKTTQGRTYLQIVENRREEGRVRQRVMVTLGRLDELKASGHLESLLKSGIRFAEHLAILDAHRREEGNGFPVKRIGPSFIFEKLWQETECLHAITENLKGTKFSFPVERAIFLTVLHRLFDPGSDRAAEKWQQSYRIKETEGLQLHHLYRAMFWLGKPLDSKKQAGATPFSPRCTKDLIEEELFFRRRDLFTELSMVFFDTTTLYFEGEGGKLLGELGHNKDGCPECKQMIVGVVMDNEGNPICCEMWPGSTSDVTTLIPVAERLKKRFRIRKVCVVADRGMISKDTIAQLESDEFKWDFILGARMRRQNEVKEEVLSRAGRYQEVRPKGFASKDPSPLKVKEVWHEGRRYVICLNEDQAKRDALVREAIIESLREKLRSGDKVLVGNKGYRKYLKSEGKNFSIDEDKIKEEARFDGKWVLRTNTSLDTAEVALKYKQLWMVEDLFRSIKSILETRPIYHKRDETIRGHVFCSFLALILRKELQDRLKTRGYDIEWADVIGDLDNLEEMEFQQGEKRFLLRSESRGCCGKVFQAARVALPPTVRHVSGKDDKVQWEECVVPRGS
jgi:hypothetical protein